MMHTSIKVLFLIGLGASTIAVIVERRPYVVWTSLVGMVLAVIYFADLVATVVTR